MHSPLLLIGIAVQVLVPCYALWRGGGPERLTASLLACAMLLSHLTLDRSDRFEWWEPTIMAIDTAVLIVMLTIAVAANRYWTTYVTTLQTMIVFAHAAKRADEFILPAVYYLMVAYTIYPIMALLALGTWRHQRRLKVRGADNGWKRSLHLWSPGSLRLIPTGF